MSISSSLESFSLPDLFRMIEKEAKSGRLIVRASTQNRSPRHKGTYYIWFQEGQLVAISDCLNHKGLINSIESRGWLSPPIVSRLRTLCPPEVPLGIYLQKMKLLSKEKLSLLFQLQLHQVYQLFHLSGGKFRFDELAELKDRILTIPWLEMTGQKIRTTEATMYALRLIDNWEIFKEQLPEPHLALKRVVDRSYLKLTYLERSIWELADGETSIAKMASIMGKSLREIQVVAFRIIAVGLVEENFPSYDWQNTNITEEVSSDRLQAEETNWQSEREQIDSIDNSLLDNVRQFWKRKFVEES